MTLVRTDQVAESIPFDPTGTTFTEENVQEAIVESGRVAAAARASIIGIFNGTVSNNQWLGYSNLLPGDQTPIVIPWDSELDVLTFSFDGTSVDGQYQLYKNGLTGGDIVHTTTFTNVNDRLVDAAVSVSLVAGDFLVGRWVDTGTNPNDMAVTMNFFLGV